MNLELIYLIDESVLDNRFGVSAHSKTLTRIDGSEKPALIAIPSQR